MDAWMYMRAEEHKVAVCVIARHLCSLRNLTLDDWIRVCTMQAVAALDNGHYVLAARESCRATARDRDLDFVSTEYADSTLDTLWRDFAAAAIKPLRPFTDFNRLLA
jgi:hypothetical protein